MKYETAANDPNIRQLLFDFFYIITDGSHFNFDVSFYYPETSLFCCELLSSPLPLSDAAMEPTQTESVAIADNGVADGDNASIKDVEVELQTKEGKIFAHETTPPIFPKAVIGGSQGSLDYPYLCSTVGDKANAPDNNSSMPLPLSLEKENTTPV